MKELLCLPILPRNSKKKKNLHSQLSIIHFNQDIFPIDIWQTLSPC